MCTGDFLILSGRLGYGADGVIPDEFSELVTRTFESIGVELKKAGLDNNHIVAYNYIHIDDM